MNNKKRIIGLATTALLWLAAGAMPTSADAQAGFAQHHTMSEICTGERCTWEKVVECDGFIEGVNFDAQGRL